MKQLRESSIETLNQIQQLLQMLSPVQYYENTVYSSSTIGAHVRHVVDHYLALRNGLDDGQAGIKRIDYNYRNRNSAIEKNISVAKIALSEISDWLNHDELNDCELEVESEISLLRTCNKVLKSTLSRELCYLINHTVHHVAYMGVIAKQLGIEVEKDIGVAPATGSYLRAMEG